MTCIHLLDWPKEERSRNVKLILREKLPVENYELFKYVIEFLVQVSFSFPNQPWKVSLSHPNNIIIALLLHFR